MKLDRKYYEYLTPKIAKEKRIQRINHAINDFKKIGEDYENQEENIIYYDEDMTLCMGKPGKDDDIEKNKHDLTPIVKSKNMKSFKYEERETFKEIWTKIYELDKTLKDNNESETMKSIYILIYRLAFMVDFEFEKNWETYIPNDEYKNIVAEIQKIINKYDKEFCLKKYLGFLDLLGWNEDYKYQYKMEFKNSMSGRLNCILCMISVPLELSAIAIEKGDVLNIGGLIDMCYDFSMSRGIFTLDKTGFIEKLNLEEKK